LRIVLRIYPPGSWFVAPDPREQKAFGNGYRKSGAWWGDEEAAAMLKVIELRNDGSIIE
jgi:hypothetical protein